MSSVEQVKLNLATSAELTRRVGTGIRGVTDQLDEALALLRLTAAGTGHPSLVDAIGRLEQARARLDEAAALGLAALDATESYRRQA